MLKRSIAALGLCLGMASCVAAAGVPFGANAEFNPLIGPMGSMVYTWQHKVEHGCADFSTSEGSTSLRLAVDPARCEGRTRSGIFCTTCGPGIFYQSDDYIVVQNYWPWSATDGITFDNAGMAIGERLCPHTLSPEQLAALRVVVNEVIARATTDAERNTLQRIDRILATTNGAALRSGQYGCMLPTASSAL